MRLAFSEATSPPGELPERIPNGVVIPNAIEVNVSAGPMQLMGFSPIIVYVFQAAVDQGRCRNPETIGGKSESVRFCCLVNPLINTARCIVDVVMMRLNSQELEIGRLSKRRQTVPPRCVPVAVGTAKANAVGSLIAGRPIDVH